MYCRVIVGILIDFLALCSNVHSPPLDVTRLDSADQTTQKASFASRCLQCCRTGRRAGFKAALRHTHCSLSQKATELEVRQQSLQSQSVPRLLPVGVAAMYLNCEIWNFGAKAFDARRSLLRVSQ